jgi:hypothetical protein
MRLRLAAFAALAAFTAANWLALVDDPPIGRAAIAVLCAAGGAAVLAAVALRVPSGWGAWTLAALTAAGIVAAVALSLGLPARLLAPSGWGELFGNLGDGIGPLGDADYPYRGSDPWSRLALLLALAPLLALAAALAFWPTRGAARRRRGLGLLVLVTAYTVAVTVSPPGQPLLRGLVLFALVAAWIWLPALDRRRLAVAAGLVLAAGLIAVPIAGRLDASEPWLDYRDWNWSGSPLGESESFDWNHGYGPLDWSRDGRTLLEIRSDDPHYWATEVLADFDGYRWVSSPAGPAVDLPPRHGGGAKPLNRRWLVSARFEDRALSSQLVVGTGTVLSIAGVPGTLRTPEGVLMRGGMSKGDTYSIRAYVPQPSAGQMRASEGTYPHFMSHYTTIRIPHPLELQPPPGDNESPHAVAINTVTPLRAGPQTGPLSAGLRRSPYARVYRLARALAVGQPTAYDVVESVQAYLRSSYRYSESSPQRGYPLRAFLFRDRIGYCQQFSGAMALMLRMVGIPTRVVGGFAPGERTRDGFLVSDLDAHSWVEVYFNGIGWVTFDPTPAAAPAVSRTSELFAARRPIVEFRTGLGAGQVTKAGRPRAAESPGGASPVWPAIAVAVAAAACAPLLIFLRRSLRRRSMPSQALVEAQALELGSAAERLGRPLVAGTTLRALERRLRGAAGPRAAAYAARLRECRYGGGSAAPPSAGERRAVRRALVSGLGLRGRLRGWLAMPPGGPVPPTGLRRRS